MKTSGAFAPLIQSFFTERLTAQRQASPHTLAAYRDSFRLLLEYAEQRLGKPPSNLRLEDLDAKFIGAFLQYLEKERGNSVRTRNVRLAAIHSFYQYVASREPSYAAHTQRVLGIPTKRCHRKLIPFLTRPEIDALLSAPDRRTWAGRRDHALLTLAVQTGLRVSELTALRRADVVFGTGAHVRCNGKGRKERCTPLSKQVRETLRGWLEEQAGESSAPLFPSTRGRALSRDGVQYLLAKHTAVGRDRCPSLGDKRISPHVLRHTNAMHLLLGGVDVSVIALWLGHESVDTTRMYLQANMALKEKIVDKAATGPGSVGRYRPDDRLMAFLKNL